MHLAKLTALACALALLSTPSLALANEFAPPSEPAAAPSTQAPAMPSPPPAPSVAPARSSSPSAPCVLDDSLSLTGSNLWTGLEHARVRLTLRNENEIDGRIVAQDRERLAVARTSDGTVVSVPKQEVAGVRLLEIASSSEAAPAQQGGLPPVHARPTDDGRKLYGAGIGLLAFGVPLGVAGTGTLAGIFFAPYIWAPILLPGIGMIIGGSVALKRSYKRQDAYRRAWGLPSTAKLRITPTFNVGRNSGQLGLAMRF